MPITVKVHEFEALNLVNARLEDEALHAALPDSAAYKPTGARPSLLRVATADGSSLKQQPDWVEWMRSHPPARRAARVAQSDGKETWVFVTPFQHAPEGELYSWLVIDGFQLPTLRAWRLSAVRPELIRLLDKIGKGKALVVDGATAAAAPAEELAIDTAVEVGADDDEDVGDDELDDAPGKVTWDTLTDEVRDAAKNLRKNLLALKKHDLGNPDEALQRIFGLNGAIAKEILQSWKSLLEKAGPHVRTKVAALSGTLVQAENDLDGLMGTTSSDSGVEGALELMGVLIRVGTQFVSAIRVERFIRSRPYVPVDYSVLAHQIASEIRAFQEAARAAAVHQGVFGSLVENHVRSLIERWVRPASLSSGAIAGLRFENQIDGIIWDHRLLPALVERGDIAVVSAQAVFGAFELKASRNEDLAVFSARIDDLREHVRALRTMGSGGRFNHVDVPILGIMVRSRHTYDDVRVMTGQNVTALLFEDESEELHVNLPGVYDVLRFVFEQVNPLLGQRR